MSDNNTTILTPEKRERLLRQLYLTNILVNELHKTLTLEEIGKSFGVSKEAISQLFKKFKAEEGGSK